MNNQSQNQSFKVGDRVVLSSLGQTTLGYPEGCGTGTIQGASRGTRWTVAWAGDQGNMAHTGYYLPELLQAAPRTMYVLTVTRPDLAACFYHTGDGHLTTAESQAWTYQTRLQALQAVPQFVTGASATGLFILQAGMDVNVEPVTR